MLKPVTRVEFQPVDFITSVLELNQETQNLNLWLSSLLDVYVGKESNRQVRIRNRSALPFQMLWAVILGRTSRKVTNLTLLDAYFAASMRPQIWDFLPGVHLDREYKTNVRIHLHLRLSNFSTDSDRFININEFRMLLRDVVEMIKVLNKSFSVVVHTDFLGQYVDKELLVTNAVPESLGYWKKLNLLNNENEIRRDVIDAARTALNEILATIENSTLYKPDHWSDEWESMASANLLIMGKSSYSAVGGLLNKRGLVVGADFWNAGKSNWFISDDAEEIKKWIAINL